MSEGLASRVLASRHEGLVKFCTILGKTFGPMPESPCVLEISLYVLDFAVFIPLLLKGRRTYPKPIKTLHGEFEMSSELAMKSGEQAIGDSKLLEAIVAIYLVSRSTDIFCFISLV